MKKLVLISGLAMMAVLAAGAEQKKLTSSAKSATHSHAAAKTPARSNSSDRGKTRAIHAGQGKKKGLTKQHARGANSKGHKQGHKKYLLFGKRSR
jgi:hypothetical protein